MGNLLPILEWLNHRKKFVLELVLILVCWYVFIGYIVTTGSIPFGVQGGEYNKIIMSLYTWEYFLRCGTCMFWANAMGGYPIFADSIGSHLHPIAIVSSLLYGAIQGSVITIALSFLLIAIATWWLAILLDLHPIARLWGTIITMYGGHIACRLDNGGGLTLTLSIAAGWLAIVGMYYFILNPNKTRAVIAGVLMGLFLTSGGGYYQFGLMISIPIFVLLAYRLQFFTLPRAQILQLVALISIITIGIAAPFLYSGIVYIRYFIKLYNDVLLTESMDIIKVMRNLVNENRDILYTSDYNVVGFPYLYGTFIGWMPVVLTILGIILVRNQRHRLMYDFFALFTLVQYFMASGDILKLIMKLNIESVTSFAGRLIHIVLLNGFGTLGIIVMAMLSLNYLLTSRVLLRFAFHYHNAKNRIMLKTNIAIREEKTLNFIVNGIVMIGCMWNLANVYSFNSKWIVLVDPYNQTIRDNLAQFKDIPIDQVIEVGGMWLHMPLMVEGYKIWNLQTSWTFGNSEGFLYKYSYTEYVPENFTLLSPRDNLWFMSVNNDVNANYAVLRTENGTVKACDSTAFAGTVTVNCSTDQPGSIRIFEHKMTGWYVWVDGVPATITDAPWLTINVTPGTHKIEYRFLPWVTIVGIVQAIITWIGSIAFIAWELRRRRVAVNPATT